MKIYTRTGDAGASGLIGGERVRKHHLRLEAYGAVDELNSALGCALAASLPDSVSEPIEWVQHELFVIGAELAAPKPSETSLPRTTPAMVTRLERAIDGWEAGLPQLREFILPGGSPGAAYLHLSRAVCRRAERRITELADVIAGDDTATDDPISPTLLAYINRLGDALFVAARLVNQASGQSEHPWRKLTAAE